MKLSQFKFELPEELIAQEPLKTRHDSRLLVVHRKERRIEHRKFHDILDIFNEGDVFVVNNTKVFTARMYGQKEKTGAQIEVFLLRELNHELRLWDVLVDPARKIRVGNKLYFGDDDLVAEVVDNTTSRGRTIRFLFDGDDEAFDKVIKKLGETPIPKYITRAVKDEDEQWYQSLFAKHVGAVAAPAAQLHLTRELLMRLDIKGINFAEVTLHLGLGAFREVEVEDLTKHKMDSEYYKISQETCDIVNEAVINKNRVVAVGGSVMRAMETSVSSNKTLNPSEGWTDKFLFPPQVFNIANAFITNLHQPESPLYMMACAYTDHEFMAEIYQEAIKEKYRFLCYGDAMLIL
ncbi:MAG: tRNA preQ1(34) S-adenosylmethionine ribosyltransferase-isomerase QueA [Crocinitomicaceae bacterium]|nr:tRNA preQ1(34) S-adenosylmethionine ribosyltransferase-isomerase QueA [Crocinitomicaceae bacterium]